MGRCLQGLISSVVAELNRALLKTSLLGDFQRLLKHFTTLAGVPAIAKALVQLPGWAPDVSNGREVQTRTLLGPAFGVTSIPDVDIYFERESPLPPAQPEAATTVFRNLESRPNEASSATADQSAACADTTELKNCYFSDSLIMTLKRYARN